jgi:hypothetical protein
MRVATHARRPGAYNRTMAERTVVIYGKEG